MSSELQCPMCGTQFDPTGRDICGSCPLSGGCELVCCPNCGYSTVDPSRSGLARWASRLFGRRQRRPGRRGRGRRRRSPRRRAGQLSLAEVPEGERVEIVGFNGLPQRKRLQLRAYGVSRGTEVEILQQSPLTIFRAENTELALERHLARAIRVRARSGRGPHPRGR